MTNVIEMIDPLRSWQRGSFASKRPGLRTSYAPPQVPYWNKRHYVMTHVRVPLFSYNINNMSQCETINGIPVTQEQIAAWSAEAEDGYDVATLKKRGRGRPGRGAEPSQVIALRLTADEISALDARAECEGKSRSEVIREALGSA